MGDEAITRRKMLKRTRRMLIIKKRIMKSVRMIRIMTMIMRRMA
jgi:hypothetical protein